MWYPKGSNFNLLGYSDSDYADCKVERKSTSGPCQFLGRSLVSWSSKKQNYVALSTAETKYVAADACCAQLLWMKQTLNDYGCRFTKIPLLCDNESAIKLVNNTVSHSRHPSSFLDRPRNQRRYRNSPCEHRKATSRYLHKASRRVEVLCFDE